MISDTKIWYIAVNDQQEGPYSSVELRRDHRITPDTLVWREGFPTWVPARDVPELNEIFEDSETNEDEEEFAPQNSLGGEDELTVAMRNDFPPLFWGLLALLLVYFLYRLFR